METEQSIKPGSLDAHRCRHFKWRFCGGFMAGFFWGFLILGKGKINIERGGKKGEKKIFETEKRGY